VSAPTSGTPPATSGVAYLVAHDCRHNLQQELGLFSRSVGVTT
jgi:hypothetical protein